MADQYNSGEAPFTTQIGVNAMLSNSALTGCPSWDPGCTTNPLSNLNALSSPPGSPAGNGEPAGNDVWANNTYTGPWTWSTYIFGNCGGGGVFMPSDPSTGHSLTAGSCNVDFAHWQSDWQQDAGSTLHASATPTPTATPSGKVGDFNSDNLINIFDLSIFLSHYNTNYAPTDLNHDNTVNTFDLSIFLSHWGT